EAVRGDYIPFQIGEAWGPPWSTMWFHVHGRVPDEWRGREVAAVFDLGFDGPTGFTCEALAWKDGRPWRGVDPNHRWLPVGEGEVDFYLEAAANPRAAESGEKPAASMIALRTSTEPAFVLRQAELMLLEKIPQTGDRLDFGEHTIIAVGHAHIDTAWEWPLREGKRKCARSWSTQVELMDEYPNFVFAASQPAQYEWIKETYPDLYARIKEKVAAGQWEPVGAMWVEADCNLPSGEALVRQMLHGKRFFMREFGYETRIVWLPDVFGYPGNLPQLIKDAGCDYFLTQKLSWNDTNPPEHHTFMWEGIDGTRVFTHFPPADTYNGLLTPEQLEYSVRNYKDAGRSNRSLYLFGWGDGGGGPQAEMIEAAQHFGILMGRAAEFFETAAAESHDLATESGELYFELHRGTYTSQARTKLLNRLAQQALREAEMWSVASGDYPAAELEAAWKTLLLNQFHDILPGSSIDWVYEDANRDLSQVTRTALGIAGRAIVAIGGDGQQIAAFNCTSHRRREVVEAGGIYMVAEVPPCGWAVQSEEVGVRLEQLVTASEDRIENDLLRIEWDDRGLLTSVFDKQAGREVLTGPGNLLQLFDDNPKNWDAWDIDVTYRDSFEELTGLTELKVLERTGLRAVVEMTREFGRSKLVQRISLDAGSRVFRFQTDVDWHEDHKLLKAAFPVGVSAREATYEIQFGHVTRPTHDETSRAKAMFEVCAQRWADLGEPRYGVALLNDCKHGYDIHGSTMRLSLLRAPTHPDPTADRGWHRFTYGLMPHPGDFREAGVIEAAEDLNAPLRLVRCGLEDRASRSLISVDTSQVVVDTIKRAEDSDATIVRLYEAWGRPCRTRIKTSLPAHRVVVCDLLERERHETSLEVDLRPFQILTLKLEPE
ncbi:MAG TPA: alpha-mannosidase, partial [Candidatus Dormibacteraeota bacterium]|nr:alpha-mannosidase [Candidatus Dormibacteraeota bacterium]